MQSSVAPARRHQRWVILALVASFIVPFVIGHFAYERGWFGGGVTNKGDLLMPPLAVRDLGLTSPAGDASGLDGRWWIVYIVPEVCDAACQQSWQALPSMQAGLGRERGRVGVLLVSGEHSATVPEALRSLPVVRQMSGDLRLLAARLGTAGVKAPVIGRWFIMDPMGWIMLSYQPPAASDAAILKAQDLLDDLQKLLKVSRIG